MNILLMVLGLLALVPVIIFYNALSWGFVVSKFYGWFILSQFPALPHFSILIFIGFMCFLGALLPKHVQIGMKKEYQDNSTFIISILIMPWATLLCGYIIHCFY